MNNSNQPRSVNNKLMIRLLAAGYVLYMLYQVVMSYIEGGSEAPSLFLLLLSIVLLGGGSVWILLVSWKEYKNYQQECKEAAAQAALEEAEAAEDAGDEEVLGEDGGEVLPEEQ